MPDYVTCKHCDETGTCKGINGISCGRCVAFWDNSIRGFDKSTGNVSGLVCSVCWGKGIAEPSSSKWAYRFPAVLAIIVVVSAISLLVLFEWLKSEHFDKILVFVSTLAGSVTGYYFGGEKANSIPPESSKKVKTQPQQHKDAT